MNLIFLDIDGVFNCELFYKSRSNNLEYPLSEICKDRLGWFNELCKDVEAKVVISSTWRMGRSVEDLKELFKSLGSSFEIIDKTPVFKDAYTIRGNEIKYWIEKNIESITGIKYYNYDSYVIIDDDSDMLLNQAAHFFQTDNYSGLTPTICYKIKHFFTRKYF